MSKQTQSSRFRFSRVMAWAPALILVVGLLFIVSGDLVAGLLTAVVGIVFWIIVRRRKADPVSQAPPGV